MVFSISVPVRGQARFLPTALESIASQSAAIQLSVMDATPDDSIQKILRDHTTRIHYSRHGADGGQSAAIQEGWDRTTGDIVSWLCADDCLFPDALAPVERIFRDRPEIDVVHGDGVFIDQDGGFIRYFPSISEDVTRITRDCCITQPSCFVRRSALERVGGIRRDLHYVMDWDLWTRLHLAGCRFHYLPQPLSASRMHPGTKTTGNSSARTLEMWRHLVRHNPTHAAVRSMVGIRLAPLVYRELGSGGETALGGLTRRATRLARRVWRSPGRNAARTLYGLEVGTNTVRHRCEIHMPSYGECPPKRFVVCTREDIPLQASVDGTAMTGAAGSESRRHVFEIPAHSDRRRHAFRFELESALPAPWRVVSAHLE